MTGIIYKITSPSGKIYIGQTTQSLAKRKDNYKRDCKTRNYGIYAAINKYEFKNMIFEEIENCNIENVDNQEIFWISYFDSCNREKGYNIESGGNKHKKLSEETKKIMSENHYSKKPGYIAPNKNKVFSEEWKKNMKKPKTLTDEQRKQNATRTRLLHKGKKQTEEHKSNIAKSKLKPVIQYSLDNIEIKKWDSIQDACKILKTSAANISGCLKGKQNTAAGSKWKYV